MKSKMNRLSLKQIDVVGVGSVVLDFLVVLPEYPAPNSKNEIQDFSQQAGGNIGTALVTLTRLGARAAYLGKMGDNDLARGILEALRKQGVDVGSVILESNAAGCELAIVIVDRKTGERTILWSKRDAPFLAPEELNRDVLSSSRFLLIDQYHPDTVVAAATIARKAGATVVLDAENLSPDIDEIMQVVDIPIVSQEFAREYTGRSGLREMAEDLYRKTTKQIVVVTAGEHGCFCVSRKGSFHQPAFEVPVVDTTGCGDVFHGAFIYGLLRNWDLKKIAEFSCATAALNCRAIGGQTGIPTLGEVEKFLREQQR